MTKAPQTLVSLAFLTACGGASAVPQSAADSSAPFGTRTGTLLYVADRGRGDVLVYTSPGLKHVGTLGGLTPGGLCADAAGNVFVPNLERKQILEFAHGGSEPIATLDDGGHYPSACAIDARSGDLAVVSNDDGAGISIFRHASGTPRFVTASRIASYSFCAYDGGGNLYVDGFGKRSQFELAELPARGHAFARITLDRKIHWGGGVAWDGAYLAISDQGVHGRPSQLFRFAVTGHRGTTVSAAVLGDSLDVPQFSIEAATLIGPDTGRESGDVVRIWAYPGGGAPIRTLQHLVEPTGTAISAPAK